MYWVRLCHFEVVGSLIDFWDTEVKGDVIVDHYYWRGCYLWGTLRRRLDTRWRLGW